MQQDADSMITELNTPPDSGMQLDPLPQNQHQSDTTPSTSSIPLTSPTAPILHQDATGGWGQGQSQFGDSILSEMDVDSAQQQDSAQSPAVGNQIPPWALADPLGHRMHVDKQEYGMAVAVVELTSGMGGLRV